jgi:hypothetical protein
MEIGFEKRLELNPPEDKQELKELKDNSRKYKRYAAMLTPMSKYYCSEMCNSVAYDSIQVLGGSGFMRDYACERHARDARITTIYEGTSQLQVVAAVRGVCSGTAEKYLADLAALQYAPELSDLLDKLAQGTELMKQSVAFIKERGNEYMDLYGRPIVDIAIDLIIGYLFCGQASSAFDMPVAESVDEGRNGSPVISMKKRKAIIARRFVNANVPTIESLAKKICSGDKSTFTDYQSLVGPVVLE